MSTVTEIEAAIERLAAAEQREVADWQTRFALLPDSAPGREIQHPR